jgi:hypothetical protein
VTDRDLYARFKEATAQQGQSLRQAVLEALPHYIENPFSPLKEGQKPSSLPEEKVGGPKTRSWFTTVPVKEPDLFARFREVAIQRQQPLLQATREVLEWYIEAHPSGADPPEEPSNEG